MENIISLFDGDISTYSHNILNNTINKNYDINTYINFANTINTLNDNDKIKKIIINSHINTFKKYIDFHVYALSLTDNMEKIKKILMSESEIESEINNFIIKTIYDINNKKKVCIFFAGNKRNFDKSYQLYIDNLCMFFDNDNISYNIYGHTYDELIDIDNIKLKVDNTEIISDFLYEKYKNVIGFWSKNKKTEITKKIGCILYLYSLFESFKMLDNSYDMYIFSRYDVAPNSNMYDVIKNIKLDDNIIYTPLVWSHGSVCDRFAIGNYNAMKTYCERLNILNNDSCFHSPEIFLRYYLIKNNMKNGIMNIDLMLT